MAGFDFQQRQTQTQIQTMSQRQIQSLELLSLSSEELRESIYREIDSNPALILSSDNPSALKPRRQLDNTRVSSKTSLASNQAMENFQKALEAKEDTRETLQAHLLQQLNMMNFSEEKYQICKSLIYNLSDKGFHILSPASLLNRENPLHTLDLLEECIHTIQQMDPVGTCTKDYEDSLFVQAKNRGDAPRLALFILDGRLSMINPPLPERALKKVKAYLADQKKLFASQELEISEESLTTANFEKAIDFIKTLNPFPAAGFGTESTHFVEPDIYVEKLEDTEVKEDLKNGIINCNGTLFKIRLANNAIPKMEINPIYQRISQDSKSKAYTSDEKKYAGEGIRKAKDFMENIVYRQNTLLASCCTLVKQQAEFFKRGQGNLVPFTQKNLAEILNVHESTVSRMARSKYLQCEWGLFELSYFFSNKIPQKASISSESPEAGFSSQESGSNEASGNDVSKDKIIHMIQEILEEHKNDTKKLSDQKLSDLLAEKGISVARRTIAKYRSQLNINSSYDR